MKKTGRLLWQARRLENHKKQLVPCSSHFLAQALPLSNREAGLFDASA
jgi:hypothetical protein